MSGAAASQVISGHAPKKGNNAQGNPKVGQSVVLSDARTAYAQAKRSYDALVADHKSLKNKRAWEDVITQFRRIYLQFPEDGDIAPKSLWMLGRCYDEMYGWIGDRASIDEAITRYTTLVEKFPQNPLADDALMAVARLHLLKSDKDAAISAWRKVVSDYANGDMVAKAKERLKAHGVREQTEAEISVDAKKQKDTSNDSSSKVANTSANQIVNQNDSGETLPNYLNNSVPPALADNAFKMVEDVRYWSVADYTRVVIATSGPVSFKEGWLPGDEGKGLPRRFYIDISPAHKSKKLKDLVVKSGFLKAVRIGQFDSKTVRVVCDLGSSNDVKAFYLEDPFRVIIDAFGESYKTPKPCILPSGQVRAGEAGLFERRGEIKGDDVSSNVSKDQRSVRLHSEDIATSKRPDRVSEEEQLAFTKQKMAMLKGKPSLARQLGLCVRRIVVDPGHGGKDPGAIGPTGLKEKDVTLKLAKKVAARLRDELGAEVILTRDKDIFVPLEQRTAIANAQKADLFVSIHTNAAPSSRLRGIETYYLNFAVDEHAMRVAALENASSSKRMGDLSGILNQILKNTKVDESSRLAKFVQDALVHNINGAGGKDLGVKQAPFFVLIGAKMPSILVETSFISNEEEERLLRDNTYLDRISQGIVSGLRNYMKDMGISMGGG